MNIVNLPFEESLIININGEMIKIVAFKTLERGNVKFGIQAPRTVQVHREEIHQIIRANNQPKRKNK